MDNGNTYDNDYNDDDYFFNRRYCYQYGQLYCQEVISSSSPERTVDVPTDVLHKRRRVTAASSVEFETERLPHRTREACGWEPSSPHRYIFARQIDNTKPQFLRLHLRESWQLSAGEEYPWDDFLSKERGSRTLSTWRHSLLYQGVLSAEIPGMCPNGDAWLYDSGSERVGCRLFFIEQAQDRGVRILVFGEKSQFCTEVTTVTDTIYWARPRYNKYRSMAQFEFVYLKAFQISPALPIGTSELFENVPGVIIGEVFANLSYAVTGGVFRLLL